MMVKIFGVIFLVLVLISSVSAQSGISDIWRSAIGIADITIESNHTEVGWPNSSGYYNLDCTFTLVNKGDADGFATVDLETDKGMFLKKLTDLEVPKKASSTYNTKVAISLLSFPGSDTIKYRIESQRAATVDEVVAAANSTLDVAARLVHTAMPHVNIG